MSDELRFRRRRPAFVAGVLLLALVAGFGIAEWLGWPFLAQPLQQALSHAIDRRVRLDVAAAPAGFRLRFLGSISLRSVGVDIASPTWSAAPHLLMAREVELELRYIDLWRAWRGQPLRIESLQAVRLDAHLERLADGRASWQLDPDARSTQRVPLPRLGRFMIGDGLLRYSDTPRQLDIKASVSVADVAPPEPGPPGHAVQVDVTGRYRSWPVKLALGAVGAMSDMPDATDEPAVALIVKGTVGAAALDFQGKVADVRNMDRLIGRFRLEGPSLAAIGDLLGVTLPSTPPFRAAGAVDRQGKEWRVEIDDATVGSSQLIGDFVFRAGGERPSLTGELRGRRLLLADLGPALRGAPSAKNDDKVLPRGRFDLGALRAMDADIRIDIDEVGLGSRFLDALRPLRGQLQLEAGVLSIIGLDARTGQGWLKGDLRLDGRGDDALWTADLRWGDVRLEQWIRQDRADPSPYVSGRLGGRATVSGQGRSTGEILASLEGRGRMQVIDGKMSHLVVEAAGLDLAEALGVLLTGDDALPLHCAVAEIQADAGVLRPQVMVLDTGDSTVSVGGSLSLATETLDLTAVAIPKDFSPLTLRSPLRVQGSFADPQVSLEKKPIGMKVAGAVLLALINPLAALISLVDAGDTDDAERIAAGCVALARRGAPEATPGKPAR